MNLTQVRDQIDLLYGPPMTVLSDCIRAMITASPGHELLACDFSAIEARGLAWLAGEERILEIFRGDGKIYEHAASGIYRVPIHDVTADQRQIGKVAVLALGYGGGIGAFQTMAKGLGVKISDKDAEAIKSAWREANPAIVNYWRTLNDASMAAVGKPGLTFTSGPKGRAVAYKYVSPHLCCRLPSGRVIFYPFPKIGKQVWAGIKFESGNVITRSFWGESAAQAVFSANRFAKEYVAEVCDVSRPSDILTYMSEDSVTHQWARTPTYGGSLAENICQAVCRDLLAEAMVRLEERGYPIVVHVHDEAVSERKIGEGSVSEMEKIMSEVPLWAKDFPIEAKGWRGFRYRK